MAERLTPYLVATSVDHPKFRISETIKTAAEVNASGVQMYLRPERFLTEAEVAFEIVDLLSKHSLHYNVVHLPDQLGLVELMNEENRETLMAIGTIGASLISPIPGAGKVLIAHHSLDTTQFLGASIIQIRKLLAAIGDDSVIIGLENTNPWPDTGSKDYAFLSSQVDQYLTFLKAMQDARLPTLAVLDITRFWSQNESLGTDGDRLVKEMTESLAGQPVLVHAADFANYGFKPTYEINARPIGQGLMMPHYKNLVESAQQHGVKIIGVIDESETRNVISPVNTLTTQNLFSF